MDRPRAHQLGDLLRHRPPQPLLELQLLLHVAVLAAVRALLLREVLRPRPAGRDGARGRVAHIPRPNPDPHQRLVQLGLLLDVLHPRRRVRGGLRHAALPPLVARHLLVRLGVVRPAVVERVAARAPAAAALRHRSLCAGVLACWRAGVLACCWSAALPTCSRSGSGVVSRQSSTLKRKSMTL
jgi:hypothetical protein